MLKIFQEKTKSFLKTHGYIGPVKFSVHSSYLLSSLRNLHSQFFLNFQLREPLNVIRAEQFL